MVVLLYFLKVFLYSGFLFGYYYLFLRNRRFHHYNRYFLLATLVLSVVLPLVNIPVFDEGPGTLKQALYQTVSIVTAPRQPLAAVDAMATEDTSWLTLSNATWLLYTAGALALLALFARSLWQIRLLARRYPYELVKRLKFYHTQEPGTPFSFFSSVFWNTKLDVNSEEGQQVFRHELFHVQQKHSADVILAELITIAGWFNPFFYLIRKELKAIHEFLADQYATSGSDRYAYAEMLVQSIIKSRNLPLTHPFFQHQVKRRITMIIKNNNIRYGYWSRLLVLPVSVLLFFSMALYAGEKHPAEVKVAAASEGSYAEVFYLTYQTTSKGKIVNYILTDEKPDTKGERLSFAILHVAVTADVRKMSAAERRAYYREHLLKTNRISNTSNGPIAGPYKTRYSQMTILPEEADTKAASQLPSQSLLKTIQQVDKEAQNNSLEIQQTIGNPKGDTLQKELAALKAKEKALQTLRDSLQTLQQKTQQNEQQLRREARRKLEQNRQQQQQQDNRTGVQDNTIGVTEDTTQVTLNRFIMRRMRYPQAAIDQEADGAAYVSIDVDEKGALKNYKAYQNAPAEANGKIKEIVTIGYGPKKEGEAPKPVPAQDIQKLFQEEAARIFSTQTSVFAPGGATTGRYFFKLVFKIEKGK